jgi:hypothetical protein
MELDPIPDEVRQFLVKTFADVRDEPAQGESYVFSLTTSSGQLRRLKVHRQMFVYSGVISAYLQDYNFAAQLERGDVEITKPLSP